MRIQIIVLIIFLLVGCSAEQKAISINQVTCDDGRSVPDAVLCDLDDDPILEMPPDDPGLVVVGDSKVSVSTGDDAKDAFSIYVYKKGQDWKFVSADEVSIDGKRFFKVTYSYSEASGGKNQVIISPDGKVYNQLPII